MSRLSIRLKVALAFSAAMALVLTGVGTFLYFRTKDSLDSAISGALRSRAADLAALIETRSSNKGRFGLLPDPLFQLARPDGRLAASSPQTRGVLLRRDELQRAAAGRIVLERHERLQLLAEPIRIRDRRYVLVVGASLAEREHTLETLAAGLAIGGPIALLLAALAGYGLATFALRPVERMRARADDVSLNDSSVRMPLPSAHDEIYRLATTLNTMLNRLHHAVAHERTFIADASHELRTPLARMRTELDLARRHARTPGEFAAALHSVDDETNRLVRLAEDLLALSGLDDGVAVHAAEINAAPFLQQTASRFEPAATRARREIIVRVSHSLRFHGDATRLQQALANMIENAIQYGSGPVEIEAQTSGSAVELHVRDTGRGISTSFVDRAFDRFSRGEDARNESGSGLGLAIVRAVAHGHGGNAFITPREPQGTDVWISLPAAEATATGDRGHESEQL